MTPDFYRLQNRIRQATEMGIAPAVAVRVTHGHTLSHSWYAGSHRPDGEGLDCGPNTVFDLASLTKPLTTSLWCLRLVESGRLSLDDPIGKWVDVSARRLSQCPVWHLMNHTSGLPAHRPYFTGLGPGVLKSRRHHDAKTSIRRMISLTAPISSPGTTEIYSDLSYLLLEDVCEQASSPLDGQWLTLPGHGDNELHFRPLPRETETSKYAATEHCPWRKRLLQGEVHDDNCWTMGGIGGHAGLFGTLHDVHWLGEQWLLALQNKPNGLLLSPELIERVIDRKTMNTNGTRILAWDTPTPGRSSAGDLFSRDSIGHLGFTGTSLWIDPSEQVVITILTNRVSPSRDDTRIRSLRPELHNLIRHWLRETP